MSIETTNFVSRKYVSPSSTLEYRTITGVTAIIDKATVTNVSTASATFSCWLPNASESPINSNLIIDDVTIAAGETYLCPELIGQVLTVGCTIYMEASASNALTVSIGGREKS